MPFLTILLLLSFSVTQSVSAIEFIASLFGFKTPTVHQNDDTVTKTTFAQVVAKNPIQATDRQQVAAFVGTVKSKRKPAKKASQSCECSLPDYDDARKFPKLNYRGPKAFKNRRQNLAFHKHSPHQ